MNLAELRDKVASATGPDREIDKEILAFLGFTWRGMNYWHQDGRMWNGPVFFTASIDAALALVERVLPEAIWTAERETNGRFFFWIKNGEADSRAAFANTLSLAILSALLAALPGEQDG